MSLADSDFDNAGFDSPFEGAAEEVQQVAVAPKPVYRKQEFNVYSLLLIISFIMLVVANIMLFIEVGRFE